MNQIDQTHEGNRLNQVNPSSPAGRSTFNYSSLLAQTMRFAEITPHFVLDGVPSDRLSHHGSYNLQSYTLRQPLLQGIKMHRDYFAVPRSCILPFQWERIYEQPKLGDDVPDDASTSVKKFVYNLNQYFKAFRNAIASYNFTGEEYEPEDNPTWPVQMLRLALTWAVHNEYICSRGSLLNTLGYDGSPINPQYVENFDKLFDTFISDLSDVISSFTFALPGDPTVRKCFVSEDYPEGIVEVETAYTIRTFLETLRDNGTCDVLNIYYNSGKSRFDMVQAISDFVYPDDFVEIEDSSDILPVDLARLFAYQIVCAHFYTNDSIDYVYSAELYRQLIYSDITDMTNQKGYFDPTFVYNGLIQPYDYLSSHFFDYVVTSFALDALESIDGEDAESMGILDDYLPLFSVYFSHIFAFRHSLRFMDYFTGSRTRPLAIGNTDIPVSSNKVSVIDVTRNIQLQRFFNAVNRSGRKLSQYVQSLFPGAKSKYDYHDPEFLVATDVDVYGDNTQNTGDDQIINEQSITSVLRSSGNRYIFDFEVDMISNIIIGVTYFDLPRLYTRSIDRHFFHSDRFDMFNPFLEHIGDQPIYDVELDSRHVESSPFSYTGRYMEYKQRVSRAVGGFALPGILPGTVFKADVFSGSFVPVHISPRYIRSSNAELDDFYLSLSGYSLGTYFHFCVLNSNAVEAHRPMQYNPQIL